MVRNAKVRKIRKSPSIVLFGRAPYPDNPRGLRDWRGKFTPDEFLHPGVMVKPLTPKQPPLFAQRAAHQPLSRQGRETAENYNIRSGNIRQIPIHMSAGTAERQPKSRQDPLKRPEGFFGPRGVGRFCFHIVYSQINVISRGKRAEKIAL